MGLGCDWPVRTERVSGDTLQAMLRGRPSPGRGLKGPSDLSHAALGRGDSQTATSPKTKFRERSSRAFSDARVRADRASRDALQARLRGRPSPGRGLWGPSDLSHAALGRGDSQTATSPKTKFGERSSRAFSDARVRATEQVETHCKRCCADGPHPDEA